MANASPSRTFLNELASQLAAVPSAPIDIDIDINQLANMLREGPKIERADGSQSGRLSELLANVISPQQAFYLQPYYLNNRRRFVSFVNELFAQLKGQDLDLSKEEVQDVCSANNDSDEFSLKLHQKIVERYMNKTTPYRGLLLFHGLGSGKTCSSIAIAEAMKTTKPILVILPATLKDNYRKQIKFCGSAQYRTTVRWQPRNVTELSDAEKQALGTEGLQQVWSASAAGQPFEALTQDEQRAVVAQIDKLIDQKFTFISLDSPVLNDTLAKLKTLDNHVVILDEVQRLLTMITNKIDLARRLKNEAVLTKSAPGMLYNMLTTAKNSRIVFLSGTPMTNTADEIGVMYNMLRGNITVWEWKATDVTQLQDQLRNNPFYLAEKYKLIDVVQVDNNSIRVTRNPFGFVNKFATSNDNTIVVFEGVEYSELGEGQVNDADFVSEVTRILKAEASGVTGPGEKPLQFKAFPDNPDDFYAKYVENDTEVKNSQLFQTRILGLTSFFKPQDTTEQQQMLPQLDMQVCYCPASKIQTLVYDDLRRERRGKGEGSLSDDDYMFYERSVSNFVLPVELQKERKASDDTTKVALLSSFNKLITFLFENYGSTLLSLNKVKKDDVVNNTLFQSIKQELETNLTQFVKPFAKLEEMITTEFKTYEKPLTVFLQYKSDKEYALTKELKKSVVLNKVLAMQHNLFYFDSQAVKLIETPIERSSHLTGFAASVQEMDVSVDYTSASSSDLYTFSPKMLIMAQHILRAPKFKHLVYSDKLVFDGVDYMGYVLEEQGYEEFTIAKLLRKTEKPLDLRKRYFIKYTGEQSIEDRNALLAIYNLRSARDVATLQSTAERPIRNYVEVFLKDRAKALGKNLNERYNIFGDIIHVFMTTSAGSTGLDLKNTRYVHIMEPYWQFVRMEQTIGRARRICSHVDLPKKEWRVQVYFYLTIFNKAEKQFDKSIDWKMLYNVAARKKDLSDNFLRIMQSSAIDCKLHAHDNKLCFDYGSKENMNPAIESYVPDGNQPYVTEPAFVQGALLRQRNAQGQEIRVYDLSRYVSAASYADWQNGKTRPMTQEDVRYVASQLPKLRQTEAGTVRQFPAPERQRVDEEEKDVEEAEVYAIDEEETKDKEESKVTLLSASSSSGSSSDPIVIDESASEASASASPPSVAPLGIPVPSYPGPPTVRAETPFAPELFLLQRVPASVRAIVKNMIDNVDVIAPSFHAELTLPYASFLLPSSILNQKYWSSPDRAGLRVHVIAPNLATLTPNTCTENEILNGTLAYMKILHARKDVLILDSAFYSTLRPSSAQGTLNLEANSVARAARYIDVSQYRLILVPVHGAAHWSLGAIWPQMNEVTYYDSLGSAAKHSTVCDDLRLWYQDRMRKQNQSGNFVLTTRPVPRALIRQDNLDCGLYMLFFAEMLMLQQEARLETPQPGDSAWVSQHMPLVRELIAYLFMQYRVDQEMVWNKPASPSASAPRSRKRVASPGEQTATSMKKSKKQGGTRKISRH